MKTAATAINVGSGCNIVILITANIKCPRIVIAYIRERDNTKTYSQMTRQTETGNGILEVCIVGILLHAFLRKVSHLKRKTCIKDEGS